MTTSPPSPDLPISSQEPDPEPDPAEVWLLDQVTTRTLVEELLRIHNDDGPLDIRLAAHQDVASIVWPLGHQVFRFATAALALVDAGTPHEAHVFVRTALEHVVTAHYVAERGAAGAEAWHAAQRVRADTTINLSMATMELDEAVRRGAEQDAMAVLENTALDSFYGMCAELGHRDLYGWWAFESTYVHPTSVTQNMYFDPRTRRLSDQPLVGPPDADAVRQSFALMLLWATTVLDELRVLPKHRERTTEFGNMMGRRAQLLTPSPKPGGYGMRKPRKRGWTAASSTVDAP